MCWFSSIFSDVSPLGWSMMVSWRRRKNGLCVVKEHTTTIFDKAPVVNKKSGFASSAKRHMSGPGKFASCAASSEAFGVT